MAPDPFLRVEANPDAAARRLMQRAHTRDGLPEIAIGLIFLLTAAIQWLQVAFPPGSFWHAQSALGMALLVAPLIGVSPWLIRYVRRKFLIERQGYMKPKPVRTSKLVLAGGIAFAVAAGMALAVSRGKIPTDGLMLGVTGICGGMLAVLAGRLPRFVAGGAIMAIMGMFLAFSRVSPEMGFLILFGAMGALSLASGAVTFLLFMRQPYGTNE
ncbi:MAG: hypothetical protein P4L40_18180 [Terracidiphilus sp.]|nr:hypothetical protein [Terracidiphilus sp.]